MALSRSSTCRMGTSPTAVIRSPRESSPPALRRVGRSPACAAGPRGTTSITSTPSSGRRSDVERARTCWSSATLTPSVGRVTRPWRISWLTTRRTVSTGIAKPMPTLPARPRPPAACGEKMAVFTPISRPRESSSGPPELPGLIAASVWMQPLIGRPPTPSTSRPSAETTPVVRVWSSPNLRVSPSRHTTRGQPHAPPISRSAASVPRATA
mmetsp:Transcript_19959/g.53828  ORF Transcript_19959/g.53828 Transcript_19959/m.53828 type:complete len:211 (-) Transcript_19959:1056-1688(-)